MVVSAAGSDSVGPAARRLGSANVMVWQPLGSCFGADLPTLGCPGMRGNRPPIRANAIGAGRRAGSAVRKMATGNRMFVLAAVRALDDQVRHCESPMSVRLWSNWWWILAAAMRSDEDRDRVRLLSPVDGSRRRSTKLGAVPVCDCGRPAGGGMTSRRFGSGFDNAAILRCAAVRGVAAKGLERETMASQGL